MQRAEHCFYVRGLRYVSIALLLLFKVENGANSRPQPYSDRLGFRKLSEHNAMLKIYTLTGHIRQLSSCAFLSSVMVLYVHRNRVIY